MAKEFDASKTPGAFGDVPEHAQREVAQPLSPDTIAAQLAQARANERTLNPLAPQGGAPNAAESALAAAAAQRVQEARQARPAGEQYQPAASNSDSPSRGIPTPVSDPNLRPTGGFGDAMSAQYNPLNGLEVAELCRSLMDRLNDRLGRDLRFHIGIAYPRLKASVTITIEGYASDAGFTVEERAEHTKTPEDVAQAVAAPTTVVLEEVKQEFDEGGTPENPPDRVRDELGIEKPRKQWVGTGPNRDLVDIVQGPGDLF